MTCARISFRVSLHFGILTNLGNHEKTPVANIANIVPTRHIHCEGKICKWKQIALLKNSIVNVVSVDGPSNLALGLRTAAEQFRTNGNRPTAQDVVLVVTDGHTNDFNREVLPAAQALKLAGVTIVSVGLFAGVNRGEMRQLASTPRDTVFIPDPAGLKRETHIAALANLLCQTRVVPTPPPGKTVCSVSL